MQNMIKPYIGVDDFALLSSEKTIKEILKNHNISFVKEIWRNQECTVKVPWSIITTENSMSFFFANDKLFKIYLCEGFIGSLPNGIAMGTNMEDAKKIDPSLTFDDWEEVWTSDDGYWLEDSLDTNSVMSITVFIEEALDDDLFEKYEW